jgi:hypothetical protein
MKNLTLAMTLGIAVTTTAIGMRVKPVSAVTITNVTATSFKVGGNLFVNPGERTTISLRGEGSFSWKDAILNEKVTTFQEITIEGDNQFTKGSNDRFLTTKEGTLTDALGFTPSLTAGKYTAKYTISVNPSDTKTESFEIKTVPEPLTILGSGMALGFGTLFKKEYSRKQKKVRSLEKQKA